MPRPVGSMLDARRPRDNSGCTLAAPGRCPAPPPRLLELCNGCHDPAFDEAAGLAPRRPSATLSLDSCMYGAQLSFQIPLNPAPQLCALPPPTLRPNREPGEWSMAAPAKEFPVSKLCLLPPALEAWSKWASGNGEPMACLDLRRVRLLCFAPWSPAGSLRTTPAPAGATLFGLCTGDGQRCASPRLS